MQQNSNKRIMRRIYAIYLWHRLINPMMLKVYVVIAFVAVLSASVSISHVIANMPAVTNFSEWYQFNIAAFNHTELSVKVLLASVIMLGIWLLRDLIKTSVMGAHGFSGKHSY